MTTSIRLRTIFDEFFKKLTECFVLLYVDSVMAFLFSKYETAIVYLSQKHNMSRCDSGTPPQQYSNNSRGSHVQRLSRLLLVSRPCNVLSDLNMLPIITIFDFVNDTIYLL